MTKQLVVIDYVGHERLEAYERDGEIYLSIEPPPSQFIGPTTYRPPCEVRDVHDGRNFMLVIVVCLCIWAAVLFVCGEHFKWFN